ncbi:Nuclear transcription factor Y subunit B-9 [Morus notabilis]|uniref:Nuclear transcription factor Y subunit B-9 n=1 Tax=Morus notabilis TaxID=981085 RepID=W9QFS5_9ROSA|nr:Nuclear transcription factor Y subunit B-9 [Morus notabilis]
MAVDLLWAMAKLGFDDYVEPLTVFLNGYRESETEHTNPGRHEPFLRRGGSGSGGGGGGGGGGSSSSSMA